MDRVTIRREAEADIPAIRELNARAFEGKPYSEQKEAAIVERLRDADALTLSFIAVKGPVISGHIAASPVSISDGTPGWYSIGPISVAPEAQGQGLGSQMLERALEELRSRGAAGIVALGDPAFYARFGMRTVPELYYPGFAAEYFLVLPLNGEPLPAGEVSYHPAFG